MAGILDNLSVLLVIPDVQSKTKLREVLRSFLYKVEFHYEKTLKHAQEKLSSRSASFNFVIVSSLFKASEIDNFLSATSNVSAQKSVSVIIYLAPGASEDSGRIASLYVSGVAGFISDPYTSDDLISLLTKVLESKKNKSFSETKARKAIAFMMADAMALIDQVSKLICEGKEGGYALKDLRNLSTSFASFFEQDRNEYERVLTEVFQNAKPQTLSKTIPRTKPKVKIAKHPGVMVWELMKQRDISEERLAALLRIDSSSAHALSRGQIDVDQELAKNLSRIFGMTPREWLKIQADFDAFKKSRRSNLSSK